MSEYTENYHKGMWTGCFDKFGKPIHEGQFVQYEIEGKHTKKEFWNPVYRVIFEAPGFTLKNVNPDHKSCGSERFRLTYGGPNNCLKIVDNPQPLLPLKVGVTYKLKGIDKPYTCLFETSGVSWLSDGTDIAIAFETVSGMTSEGDMVIEIWE